jgi:hypothetical protein
MKTSIACAALSFSMLAAVGCDDGTSDDDTETGAGAGPSSGNGPTGGPGTTGVGGSTGDGGSGSGGAPNDLVDLASFQYEGGFRIPADDFGSSSANYAAGPIAFNPANQSLFLVGHAQQHPIAEFVIPALASSMSVGELPLASAPAQGFTQVLSGVSGGNPQEMNSIGGMLWFDGPNGPELIINAYEYYDAPADNSHTTMVIRDASNIEGAARDGWFSLDGGAHASGWMSAIPQQHQATLGGAFITGQSSGIPIISRLSVGPSAFVFDPASLVGGAPPGDIATATLLDFSLDTPLADDLMNDMGQNDLWTHLSRAAYGFIPPGTRTYVTIGASGGHESGVCYKCVPEGETQECGGYCAKNPDDYANYYWLWDVDDLIRVKNGEIASHEVLPYEYGVFPTPFSGTIAGGAYDAASGLLYLTLLYADDSQGEYAVPPLVIAYSIH